MLGNETIAETQGFHRNTGQMAFINVTANGQLRHHIDYDEYDVFGNVTRQIKHYPDEQARETFTYDELHRLTSSVRSIVVPDVSGGISLPDLTGTVGSSSGGSNGGATNDKPTSFRVNYRYDAVGNLTHKSDFGHIYAYGNDTTGEGADCYGGPNAVMYIAKTRGAPALYCYDKRGNQISGDGRNITYNAFNHPTNISENTNNSMSSFAYGADLQRYRQIHTEGSQTTYTYYIDKLSEIKQVGSEVEVRNYIADYAVVTEKLTGTLVDNALENLTTSGYTMSYLHKDRLGSVATITDETGAIKERRGFDPFGKPRKGSWEDKPLPIIGSDLTDRGFTGHEHLDSSQLIHMNGRIYDYNSGRFLSVDPVIQAPGNSQSMNPYSYIMNNPLAGVDPTGYTSEGTPETQEEEPKTRTVTKYMKGRGSIVRNKVTFTETYGENGEVVSVNIEISSTSQFSNGKSKNYGLSADTYKEMVKDGVWKGYKPDTTGFNSNEDVEEATKQVDNAISNSDKDVEASENMINFVRDVVRPTAKANPKEDAEKFLTMKEHEDGEVTIISMGKLGIQGGTIPTAGADAALHIHHADVVQKVGSGDHSSVKQYGKSAFVGTAKGFPVYEIGRQSGMIVYRKITKTKIGPWKELKGSN